MSADEEEARQLGRDLVDDLLPAAITFGAFPPASEPLHILAAILIVQEDRQRQGLSDVESLTDIGPRPTVPDRVRLICQILVQKWAHMTKDRLAGRDGWSEELRPLRLEVSRLRGYIDGAYAAKLDRPKEAAGGRRKTGDQTKARIREAAAPFRAAGTDKTVAADAIAESIHKSPDTVRRLLSELFPGASWSLSERR